MKYFFILGNNPTLSIAEILAVFSESPSFELLNEQVFVLETGEFDAQLMIRRLGGTIKIGKIDGELPAGDYKKMAQFLFKSIDLKDQEGKFKYGISYYGKNRFNIKPVGMEIKNFLKDAGKSARWVISREPVLSSVVVEQNKLIDKGVEFVLIPGNEKNKTFVGKTLAVQPFKELSFRDYGRPGRDDRSGMLPPKLAQIMINLAVPKISPLIKGAGGIILLDPFCGSGTILTEAMLMGCENIVGTDISERAIEDTKINLAWIIEKFRVQSSKLKVLVLSATELSKKISPDSIDAIATEPYLGPQRGKVELTQVARELEKLYSASLIEFKKVLKTGGRAVMVWPSFAKASAGKPVRINPDIHGLKIINPIPENLRRNKILKLTDRNTIVYGREGQKVWREIVVLEK